MSSSPQVPATNVKIEGRQNRDGNGSGTTDATPDLANLTIRTPGRLAARGTSVPQRTPTTQTTRTGAGPTSSGGALGPPMASRHLLAACVSRPSPTRQRLMPAGRLRCSRAAGPPSSTRLAAVARPWALTSDALPRAGRTRKRMALLMPCAT
ncbi:hypothetical protein MCOR02_000669 [Pyricularia oryzae]|nr:hypothetical protein MCOR02_000669 [Pyricularia oryzae]